MCVLCMGDALLPGAAEKKPCRQVEQDSALGEMAKKHTVKPLPPAAVPDAHASHEDNGQRCFEMSPQDRWHKRQTPVTA